MSDWLDREKGPRCFCGMPTFVSVDDCADLVCLFHSFDSGSLFPLPRSKPDNWPVITKDELRALVERGNAERGWEQP